MKRKPIEDLFPLLESEDAFARLEAEKALRDLALRDFGFRWDAAAQERVAALERIRGWLDDARRREKARRDAASAGFESLDLGALQGMSPAEVEKHLQGLLGKAKFLAGISLLRPKCESCGRKYATVEIVEVKGRDAASILRLCDACASQRGEASA